MTRSGLDDDLDEIRTPSEADLDRESAYVRGRIRSDFKFLLVIAAVCVALGAIGFFYYV